MEHDLELFIPILEILEIEVCNIIYNPGSIGKRFFFQFSPILEIVDRAIQYFQDGTEYGSYDPIFPGYEEVEKIRFPIFPGYEEVEKLRFPIFPGFWRMLQTSISNISRRAIINSNSCSI